ncbi:spore germination protein GerPC [Metabacillus litoralis]|uniref:spore germination protein GerPC n=1 Tax=Metabacillus TaxID=2675233 RepID=UPI000EF5DA20|nr:spore germination protein GerPC [Metabacillus litoralis]MCM3411191.1 spore germination protein GerPC [Metabacillus litoralis]UHA60319.1 spore germination protein GerPC [Metabacillus litoralis]
MYYHEMTKYLQQLHHYVQQQDKKIQQLTKLANDLRTDVDYLKKQPYTNIERIEYKFDQLKVEQLDGTLNIGLNPTDPEQIDNFEVQQKGMNVNGVQQQLRDQLMKQCSQDINHFLNQDCIHYIQQAEKQYELTLDDPHRRHIIEDIRKQIDSRIQYYINAQPLTEQDSLLNKKQEIFELVKKDVENSIMHFLQHLPKDSP